MEKSPYEVTKVQIGLLEEKNWTTWRFKMMVALRGMGVLDLVEGKVEPPVKPEVSAEHDQISKVLSSRQMSQVFSGEKDRFQGITVDTCKEKCNPAEFTNILDESLKKFENEKQRCVWFKVNIKDSTFVPLLAQKGFNFHHARDDYVMMYKWLPKNSNANLPPSCHTNLGVGAMVFNERNELLAVSERHYDYPHWKLPGGYVEKGEDIVDAAVREVREETGILSAFQSLVTFRHTHNMMYGNSDIYVLVRMKALTEKIIPSEREVKDCKWMSVEEYTNHPHVHEFNRLIVRKALHYKERDINLCIEQKTVNWSQFVRKMNYLLVKGKCVDE